jgi:16S rRNA (guanine(527)-N(7))-methyltransferase RsmG
MGSDADQLAGYIAAGLEPALAGHAAALAKYIALVEQYAGTLNLTGISGTKQLADELALEALKLLELGEILPGSRVADLGSGNGSPVIPLAICCPAVFFTAIEARQRRAAFLLTVKAALGLDNLGVESSRAEEVAGDLPHAFAIVTSRAFAKPEAMFAISGELLSAGGEVRGFAGADLRPVEQAIARSNFREFRAVGYQADSGGRHVWRARLA